MNMDPTNLFISLLFGLFGMFYTAYGKKHDNFFFILAGLSLIAFTFFSFETLTLCAVGVGIMIAPFILSKFFD